MKTLRVTCPDCGCDVEIDAQTGAVVAHRATEAAEKPDFDELLANLDKQKARTESLFEQEKKAHQDRERLLEEKFKAAKKRADEAPDDEPLRPWDLD